MITDLLTLALPAVGAAVLAYGEPHVERLVARRTLEALSVVTGRCQGQVEGQGWGRESGSGPGPGERLRRGTGAGVTVRARLRVRVGVHQWLIHKTLLRPRAMGFEQALHHASPVVSRHAMRPASPTIAQRPNAQCPMPNAQCPRGKLPCPSCTCGKQEAGTGYTHHARNGCGTGAVHMSTVAYPPPARAPLWASATVR